MEVIFTLKEIHDIAKKVLLLTSGYKIFAMHGEMGAGKTTFIHALCEAMGVTDNISSPTFAIINQYKTREDELVFHIDLYRLKDEEEAISTGVEDCLYSGNTCLVEWPENALGIFPADTTHIYIEAISNDSRKLSFEARQLSPKSIAGL